MTDDKAREDRARVAAEAIRDFIFAVQPPTPSKKHYDKAFSDLVDALRRMQE